MNIAPGIAATGADFAIGAVTHVYRGMSESIRQGNNVGGDPRIIEMEYAWARDDLRRTADAVDALAAAPAGFAHAIRAAADVVAAAAPNITSLRRVNEALQIAHAAVQLVAPERAREVAYMRFGHLPG